MWARIANRAIETGIETQHIRAIWAIYRKTSHEF
jgi:hypothetical protein